VSPSSGSVRAWMPAPKHRDAPDLSLPMFSPNAVARVACYVDGMPRSAAGFPDPPSTRIRARACRDPSAHLLMVPPCRGGDHWRPAPASRRPPGSCTACGPVAVCRSIAAVSVNRLPDVLFSTPRPSRALSQAATLPTSSALSALHRHHKSPVGQHGRPAGLPVTAGPDLRRIVSFRCVAIQRTPRTTASTFQRDR